MTLGFGDAIYSVRRLIQDRTKKPVIPETVIEEALNGALLELQHEGLSLRRESNPWVTLAAGVTSYSVALPAGVVAVDGVETVFETVTNMPIEPKSYAYMQAITAGLGVSIGPPLYYCLHLDSSGATRLLVHPEPDRSYGLRVAWRAVTGPFQWTTNETLVVSDKGAEAITRRAAAHVLEQASAAVLDELRVSQQAAGMHRNLSVIALTHALRLSEGTDYQDSITRER